jgi:hypothetical protein
MHARRGRKVMPIVAAGLTVGGVALIPGLGASAANVTSAPVEVWTQLATPLPFSGTDPVSGASRALALEFGGDEATCVVNTPGTNDFSGDCAGAHFAVTPGMGTVTIDDSQLAYVGAGRSGEADFTVTGPIAALQAALSSVTYVPPAAFSTDGGAPVPFTVEGYDAGGGGLSTRKVAIHVTDMVGAVDSWFTNLPRHVYTPRGVQLDFTPAPDPVTGAARNIAIDPPFDSSGCTYVPATMQGQGHCLVAFVRIDPPGTADRGTLLVGADTSGFAYTPLGIAGSFSVVGTEEQVQSVLSSLSYLPPDDTFVTPDDNPVPVYIQLYEADVIADQPLGSVNPILLHDEYVYVHVVDLPEDCVEVPVTTEPEDVPETTEPEDVPDTTEPEDVPETTEPEDVPDTTEPEDVPETTEPDDRPTLTIPDDLTIVTIPVIPVPIVTPPPVVGPSLGEQIDGPLGFARPRAVPAPTECPDTTTPGGDTPGNSVPGGSLPATGSPTLVIASLAGLLTASGIGLLAARGRSARVTEPTS